MFTSLKDKLINSKFLMDRLNKWSWLGKIANKIAINLTVNSARTRPHPWSTVHDYVSWVSLTDKKWSARHLPADSRQRKLPDTLVLTELFNRGEQPQRMSKKSTCLFPAFAQYLTDGFIRTRMPSENAGDTAQVRLQNTSNHQIDLCTLYGRTQEQTDALRVKSEEKGQKGRLKFQLLKDEAFSPYLYDIEGNLTDPEFKLLDPPLGIGKIQDAQQKALIFAVGGDRVNSAPQVTMINTLFLREHNRLAEEIEIDHPDWDDEQIFQTARNIVIVLFIKIVVEDYINHISPVEFNLKADPSVAWNAKWNKPNWITTEFSLLYRWHSLIPENMNWNGDDYSPSRAFMNNKPLVDYGLRQGMLDMSNQAAAELGSFNTANFLLGVEKQAIDQGRLARLATYNDYRAYVSLPKKKRFDEVSSNPNVIEFLENHYSSVDNIDFYIGLFAEDRQKNSPLPELILRFVAIDAFSQALTNPLLSEHVFNENTFSTVGWAAIKKTSTLSDILKRHYGNIGDNEFIGMTQESWHPE
ncbi:peroxidase family protein [Paraglaciecola sp. MB-3u-78]|jgi:prostaglandin-endoperoxide synthase 2|uniref:peroxidase family protein n=1 Tax=Paraglaciecola sp. MB-3u-78 TaxID=2058332 RepID=UPI0018E2BFAE|nr:peroxidase family protein [Paraglaciecola sp. MB-3u-78]